MADGLKNSSRLALTTSRAAQYCFVSKGTIQNWIKSGRLAAQRTAGGQFRVRVDQLRDFMLENNMTVAALEYDYCVSRVCSCWEYFEKIGGHAKEERDCANCVVKQTRAARCFELRKHVEDGKVHCRLECDDCEYRTGFLGDEEFAPTQ
ncbi:helix-turn-helix domain-containing protein [Candidatus Sumerlaeota bacterium]